MDLNLIAVAAVAGGVSPAFTNQRGFTGTISRAGAGNYTLTLTADNGIDSSEAIVSACVVSAVVTGGSVVLVHTSDTAKQILIIINGALADGDFTLKIERLPSET